MTVMSTTGSRAVEHEPAAMDQPLKLWLARIAHGISPASLGTAWLDWFLHLLVSPSKQADLAGSALRKGLLWHQYAAQAWTRESGRWIEPLPQDKRFSREEWEAPPFNAMSQAFLLQQQWWNEAMTGVRGVSRHHEELADFTARQWLDIGSPSNFIATNPQVLN
ncbi:MAG TPA: poly-beta-hydroxybutyrate polymerase N-terminal domain-containing protein, partial [Ramlibacter sp.]|nr:poly-beta-hydroxybutyrate polymerase N-terminal domain-containing protein [Ramlibacter sp.]